MAKAREFDLELAKNYGRQLFGGAPDTIGQSYVVQAMRHQFDLDKSAYDSLMEQANKLASLLKNYDELAFPKSAAHEALADFEKWRAGE